MMHLVEELCWNLGGAADQAALLVHKAAERTVDGLWTTIGLASKNANLIVECARDLEAQGRTVLEAILEAARIRIRPIVMTSLAFMLGALPLAIATGADLGAQNAIGFGVLGGMLASTFIGLFRAGVLRPHPAWMAGEARAAAKLRLSCTFDSEVLEWTGDALRASHADERREHEKAIKRLAAEAKRLNDRIHATYVDKPDGLVDTAFLE